MRWESTAYRYDAIGNLIRDAEEGIDHIDWTVAGKVKAVHRSGTHGGRNLVFGYGAGGHRIMKEVQDAVGDPQYRDHYIRDAQGNVMAMYRHTIGAGSLKVTERPIYGSSRVGTDAYEVELIGVPPDPLEDPIGQVKYELSDHLGNVTAVVTDELLGVDVNSDTHVDYFQPHLIGAQGYEPFGSLLPGRNYSSSSYNYGFNGQEKDDEVFGSSGTSYDFGARIYDPRVGRWLSLDPLAAKYPSESPYEFALSTPIQAKDPDGQVVVFINGNHFGDGGRAQYWRTYERELVGYEQRGSHEFPVYRSKETYAFDREVMSQFNDFKAIYRDGASGGWAPLNGMSVQGRRNEGYWQAERDAKALLENLDAGETIKIVSHSMGGAYAKGYVSGLKAYMEKHGITDVKIELEVDFAPYQPDAHENSAFGSRDPHEAGRGSVPTFQASHSNDGVAGNKPMRGAEQLDTSGDAKQGHSIFNFSSTVKKLGETLSKVREQKQ